MAFSFSVRDATPEEKPAILDLNTRAFGRPDEARIIEQLDKEGDSLLHSVAEMEGQIIGHAMYYSVRVLGKLGAVGLGPMCVDPWFQKEGVGKGLIDWGLTALQKAGVSVVFVLGHPDYYTKFGFSTDAAAPFQAPWQGPHFMAIRLRYGPPLSGKLLFPTAFNPPA